MVLKQLLICRDSILLIKGGFESVLLFFTFFFPVCCCFICNGYLLKCPIDHSLLSTLLTYLVKVDIFLLCYCWLSVFCLTGRVITIHREGAMTGKLCP